MSCMDQFTNAHVYYFCLKFNSKRLADERDKKKFLDLVLRRQRENCVQVFAFAVLDDEAYFAAGFPKPLRESDSSRLERLCEDWSEGGCPEDGRRVKAADPGTMEIIPVESMEELLRICVNIHLLPVKQGYVKLASDYWWSSLKTYRGTYLWENVNEEPLLRYLDSNVETGRRRFIRLHQEAGEKTRDEQKKQKNTNFLRVSEISSKAVTNYGNDDTISLLAEEQTLEVETGDNSLQTGGVYSEKKDKTAVCGGAGCCGIDSLYTGRSE